MPSQFKLTIEQGCAPLDERPPRPKLAPSGPRKGATVAFIIGKLQLKASFMPMRKQIQVIKKTYRAALSALVATALWVSLGAGLAAAKDAVNCDAPMPDANAQVVFLSGYIGASLSTVSVTGQDYETTVATVTVENGKAPLYVFAAAYSAVIWKFEGATDRISTLVVQPGGGKFGSGAGVLGVAKNAITFVAPESCIKRFASGPGLAAQTALAQLSGHIERPIDAVALSYMLAHIKIPSGQIDEPRHSKTRQHYDNQIEFSLGGARYRMSSNGVQRLNVSGAPIATVSKDQRTIQQMMRSHPEGVTEVRAKDLVASAEHERYEILPNTGGLLQLIADGQIEILEAHEPGDESYVLLSPFPRFPGGMYGPHSVTFIIPNGVPMPAGQLGHSIIRMGKNDR